MIKDYLTNISCGLLTFALTASVLGFCINTDETHVEAVEPTVAQTTLTPAPIPTPKVITPEEQKQIDTDKVIAELSASDIELCARLIKGEARGLPSKMEQAAVVWCALNRGDAWGKTVQEVINAKYQFAPYRYGAIEQEYLDLAQDVLVRWKLEKLGYTEVGRVLPNDYMYFHGDGKHNWFRQEYKSRTYWNWSLTNPYTT